MTDYELAYKLYIEERIDEYWCYTINSFKKTSICKVYMNKIRKDKIKYLLK